MNVSPDGRKQVDRLVGLRIREERIKRGMSQAEFARHLGVTYQQAHKYEKGVNATSVSRLLQIASVLSVDITELLPEKDEPRPATPLARADLELARNFRRVTSPRCRLAISQLVRAIAVE